MTLSQYLSDNQDSIDTDAVHYAEHFHVSFDKALNDITEQYIQAYNNKMMKTWYPVEHPQNCLCANCHARAITFGVNI